MTNKTTMPEPVATLSVDSVSGVDVTHHQFLGLYDGMKLYAHPCVSPTSDKPVCVSEKSESETQASGQVNLDSSIVKTDADEALRKELDLVGLDISAHRNPKEALSALIDWHVSVAIDPRANGGWQLVPIEPTMDMIKAMLVTIVTTSKGGVVNPKATLAQVFAAAPKYTGESK